MVLLAWTLTQDERAEFRQQFMSMDVDGRGTISLPMLKSTLARSLQLPEEEAQLVCRALGADTHEISYSEFLGAMLSSQSKSKEAARMTSLFRRFDLEDFGYITADSLSGFLGEDLDTDQFKALFQELDADEDGRVSCAELAAYLQQEVAVPETPAASARRMQSCPPLDMEMEPAREGARRAAGFLSNIIACLPLRCCQRLLQ